jgi:hypothetical protein
VTAGSGENEVVLGVAKNRENTTHVQVYLKNKKIKWNWMYKVTVTKVVA